MTAALFPRVIHLSNDWEFRYSGLGGLGDSLAIAHDATPMSIPGYWDDRAESIRAVTPAELIRLNPDHAEVTLPMPKDAPDASLPFLVGVGRYECRFEAPAVGRVIFECGPVFLDGRLLVNGKMVHHQPHYSTGWAVALDGYVKPGQINTLTLEVSNAKPRTKGCITRGYKGYSAGVGGGAQLRITDAASIADCYLRPTDRGESIRWMVDVDRVGHDAPMQMRWRIVDPSRHDEVVVEGSRDVSAGDNTWETSAAGMERWSDRQPNLYDVQLELVYNDTVSDACTQRYGHRTIVADSFQLQLNNVPVYLRGATEHAYFPKTCTAPTDASVYRQQISKLKNLGFNWLRFHTWVPPVAYLEAADELGMLIQVEPPKGADDQEWADILRVCRKHPSVIIYCAGNEELLDEAKIEQLERWAGVCRELVPDALFSPQEALRGVEYGWNDSDLGDDALAEPFLHNPRRLERLKAFSDCFGHFSWGQLSYHSSAGDASVIDRRLESYVRPCLSHELGIHGTYLNLDLEQRYRGTRIGTDLYRKVRAHLREHGLEHRAAEYYFNSCMWAQELRKHAVETARRCERLAGYDMLGAIDYHWHRTGYPCGIMNEFYELKPGEAPREVRQYNGSSVLLLDRQRCTLRAGERWEATVMASIYEDASPGPVDVDWTVRDARGRVYGRGAWRVDVLTNGEVNRIGEMDFTMPSLTEAVALQLEVRLAGQTLQLDNQWSLWGYPADQSLALPVDTDASLIERWPKLMRVDQTGGGVRVVETLAEQDIDHLTSGGRVLLLGTTPFDANLTTFQISCAGRTVGNLATCIHDHPITRRLPQRGYCDWAFREMLDRGEAVVFDNLDTAFRPIIEVVGSFKYATKQAALFEVSVGEGHLLVCSLGLSPEDPAAEHLLRSCLDYLVSAERSTPCEITPAQLSTLLAEQSRVKAAEETDQGFDQRAALTAW